MRKLILCATLLLLAPAQAAISLGISVNGQPYANAPIVISTRKPTTIAIAIGGAIVTGQVFLPSVSGLIQHGASGTPGKIATYAFYVTPARAGEITIPGFDIDASGQTIHVPRIRLVARD